MKRILLLLLTALCTQALAAEELPPAPAILASARAQIPHYPVFMSGKLKQIARNGHVTTLQVEMTLDWGAEPPRAEYTITDAKGNSQTLEIRWSRDAAETTFSENGEPAEYNPHAEIAKTGVTWNDLTFSFLWSPDAKTISRDSHFGEERYQIAIPRPGDHTLTLWVETDTGLIKEAQEKDAAGTLKKVIKVASVQHFDDLWMFKDLDIMNPETDRRLASLRIDEVVANPKQ